MADERNSVQIKLKEKGFKYGDFIHCRAYMLHLILSQIAVKLNEIKAALIN